MNFFGFFKGIAGQYWRIAAAFILGCLLTLPLAYCQGRSDGKANMERDLAASVRKVTEAALKSERAANAADALRRDAARARESELREIVNAKGTDAIVGGATGGVIERLRAGKGGKDKAAH